MQSTVSSVKYVTSRMYVALATFGERIGLIRHIALMKLLRLFRDLREIDRLKYYICLSPFGIGQANRRNK